VSLTFFRRCLAAPFYPCAVALSLAVVCWLHLFRLGSLPDGLYIDESAIAYNAAEIAATGHDEYGVHMPLYFRSFDDYKAPVYIYFVAFLFRLLGSSEFTLRLASFLCFFVGLVFAALLVSRLFPSRRGVVVFTILSFGALPHFFVVSRLGFEVISQLACTSAAVFLVWQCFHGPPQARSRLLLCCCGFVLGLSVYTYPTARLLTFLGLVSLWLVYGNKANLSKLALLSCSFAVALLPYTLYASAHASNLTARFRAISYLYSSLPAWRKLLFFTRNYFSYWTPGYLLRHGDVNLRHSTGFGGVVFGVTMALFVVGVVLLAVRRAFVWQRFEAFLLLSLLLAPVPAALTSEGTPHALRSLLLSYYILLFSAYGFELIGSSLQRSHARALLASALLLLAYEASGFLFHYFVIYPPLSTVAMDSHGFQASMLAALQAGPEKIVLFAPQSSYDYAHLAFSQLRLANPDRIPIEQSLPERMTPGTCVVYRQRDEIHLPLTSHPHTDFVPPSPPDLLQKRLHVAPAPVVFKTRCLAPA